MSEREPARGEAKLLDPDAFGCLHALKVALRQFLPNDVVWNHGDAKAVARHANHGSERGTGVDLRTGQSGLPCEAQHFEVGLRVAREGEDRELDECAQRYGRIENLVHTLSRRTRAYGCEVDLRRELFELLGIQEP